MCKTNKIWIPMLNLTVEYALRFKIYQCDFELSTRYGSTQVYYLFQGEGSLARFRGDSNVSKKDQM